MTDSPSSVLIVEDQERLAEMYAKTLSSEYDVTTAYSGAEAIEAMDDSIDVVLLDRKMPGLTGREVLVKLREAGYDCPVGLLTAVTPDWDILDIEFDDYLNKPVEMEELHRLVERLLVLGSLDDSVRRFVTHSVKEAAIEGEKEFEELAENEEFDELEAETASMSTDLGDVTEELSQRETELVMETITRNLGSERGGDDGFSMDS